jgi:hypothetical protein
MGALRPGRLDDARQRHVLTREPASVDVRHRKESLWPDAFPATELVIRRVLRSGDAATVRAPAPLANL